MTGLLDGHLAAVTGAASGIGRAIALGYAEQGADVILLDLNAEDANSVAEEIKSASPSPSCSMSCNLPAGCAPCSWCKKGPDQGAGISA